MSTDPWHGLLDEGERILWQGRPKPGLTLAWDSPMQGLMGLFFMGFSLFWMSMAAQAGGVFWMFGLIFFGIGMWEAFGRALWRAYERGHTHYTLTDRRAFIATDTFGQRRLETWPITADTPLDLRDGQPGTIYFAEKTKRGKSGTIARPIGFERINDARAVFALMREAQTGGPSE